MKVGVIGSGGREHAICFSLKNSENIKQIYCFPGNAGTNSIATNVNINISVCVNMTINMTKYKYTYKYKYKFEYEY